MIDEKEYIILADKLEYSFEEIVNDILNKIPIIMLVEDDDGYWCGKWITEENFDDLYAEFWKTKRTIYPFLFVNAKIYENNKKVNVPVGKFIYQIIRNVLN